MAAGSGMTATRAAAVTPGPLTTMAVSPPRAPVTSPRRLTAAMESSLEVYLTRWETSASVPSLKRAVTRSLRLASLPVPTSFGSHATI